MATVNAADYGAVADSTNGIDGTDNRTALINAIAAAGAGGRVNLNPAVGSAGYRADVLAAGYLYFGSTCTLASTTENTAAKLWLNRPAANDGIGIYKAASASLTLQDLLVAGNRRAGFKAIFAEEGSGSLTMTRVDTVDVDNGVKMDGGGWTYVGSDCSIEAVTLPYLFVDRAGGGDVTMTDVLVGSEMDHCIYVNEGITFYGKRITFNETGGPGHQTDGSAGFAFHCNAGGATVPRYQVLDDCTWTEDCWVAGRIGAAGNRRTYVRNGTIRYHGAGFKIAGRFRFAGCTFTAIGAGVDSALTDIIDYDGVVEDCTLTTGDYAGSSVFNRAAAHGRQWTVRRTSVGNSTVGIPLFNMNSQGGALELDRVTMTRSGAATNPISVKGGRVKAAHCTNSTGNAARIEATKGPSHIDWQDSGLPVPVIGAGTFPASFTVS